MSLTNHSINIDCKHCKCDAVNADNSIDVEVPISELNKDRAGTAILHCVISAQSHQVELKRWTDEDGHDVIPTEDIQERLLKTLNLVASKRVCGNSHICPSEVVRFVETHGRD